MSSTTAISPRVEHDFVVAPGADASQIHLDVRGADLLSVDPLTVDLVLHKGVRSSVTGTRSYQEFKGGPRSGDRPVQG